MRRDYRKLTYGGALLLSLVIAGGAYAFTASNTVPASNAGSGSGTVSGYTVSNVHYALDPTTPDNVDSVTFTIAPAVPNTGSGQVIVSANLNSGGPYTYTCATDTAGTTVTCTTTSPQLTASGLSSLTVVAAQ